MTAASWSYKHALWTHVSCCSDAAIWALLAWHAEQERPGPGTVTGGHTHNAIRPAGPLSAQNRTHVLPHLGPGPRRAWIRDNL